MTVLRITDVFIRNLKPSEQQVDHRDTQVRGLLLRVSPGGTKSFYVYCRARGRAERIKLGSYPTLSLSEARVEARRVLALARDGKSPRIERRKAVQASAASTFDVLLEAHLKGHVAHLRGAHEVERLLKKEFLPLWRGWAVADIGRADVRRAIEDMAIRAPSTASHARAAISKLFNWAIEEGLIEASPVIGLRGPPTRASRSRALNHNEIKAVLQAARMLGYPFGSIVELLLRTGLRRSEVAQGMWSELDLDQKVWMKAGGTTKNEREHIVPLTSATKRLLDSMPRTADAMFPTHGRGKAVSGFSKWKRELDQLSGVFDWRLHDLRRTVSTGLAKLKVEPHIQQYLLNHKQGPISPMMWIYNTWQYVDETRQALEKWDAYIDAPVSNRG